MSLKSPLTFLLLCLFLLACSGKPSSKISYQQDVEFAKIKTFSLFPRNSNFYNNQSLADATRNRIELSIESALEMQGLTYTEMANADVIMSYFLVTENVNQLSKYNKAVRFCLTCSETKRNQMALQQQTEDVIIVDALDTRLQRSIWRGMFQLPAKSKKSEYKNEQLLKDGLRNMLTQFPPQMSQ